MRALLKHNVTVAWALLLTSVCAAGADQHGRRGGGRDLEPLHHPELGLLMNGLLKRCLVAYAGARADLKTARADPTFRRQKHMGIWTAVRWSGNTAYRVAFASGDGAPTEATKRKYVNIKTAEQVAGAGYVLCMPGGIVSSFMRVPLGEQLILRQDGSVRVFCVPLTRKRTYLAEWDENGKLIRERISTRE